MALCSYSAPAKQGGNDGQTFGSFKISYRVRRQTVVDDRAGGRVARPRGGVARSRRTRLDHRSRRRHHSQAPQRSDSTLSGSWLPTGRRRSSGWSAPSTRIYQRRRSRSTGSPSRKEGQEAGQVASPPASRCRQLLRRRDWPTHDATFATCRARPGAFCAGFFTGDCGYRDTRVMGGPGGRNPVRFRDSRIGIAVALGARQEATPMAIATAPVDFEAYDRYSKPTPLDGPALEAAEGLRRAPERVARYPAIAGAAGNAAAGGARRHRRRPGHAFGFRDPGRSGTDSLRLPGLQWTGDLG